MVYKAKIDIGGYKEGDIVPDSKAELWIEMYDYPPVIEITDEVKEEPVVEVEDEPPKKLFGRKKKRK